jgi:hypothetical protein
VKVVSMRSLRLPTDIVSVFRMHDAPELLQEVDLSGNGKAIYVVPDQLADVFNIVGATFSERVKGGTVYVV